jgi:Phycobilisome protein
MHPNLETIFDEAENRYLKPEELGVINQYVESLPERLATYRHLRDQELNIMQKVADQLQIEMPQEKVESLERSIKNALLMLRSCSMSMLLNDESFIRERLLSWVGKTMQVYDTKAIDVVLYRLLNQQLAQTFTARQISFFQPMLTLAQTMLLQQGAASVTN